MKTILLITAGIALTVTCWGMYGPVLHKGQEGLNGDRLKPLICVGAAYFIVAIILPGALLLAQGELSGGWSGKGVTWSMMAGLAGALGAMGIILALTSGGKTIYVMPIVFGGAPVVNTFLSMYMSKAWKQGINPIFYAGLLLVIVGASLVLIYAPKGGPKKKTAENPAAVAVAEQPQQ